MTYVRKSQRDKTSKKDYSDRPTITIEAKNPKNLVKIIKLARKARYKCRVESDQREAECFDREGNRLVVTV